MLQDNSKIVLFLSALIVLLPLTLRAGTVIELHDYVNREKNVIYMDSKHVRLSNPRETKIISLEDGTLVYANSQNKTYVVRSLTDLEQIRRIRKKYDRDRYLFNDYSKLPFVSIASAKEIALKNRPYSGFFIEYRSQNKSKPTAILAAQSGGLKNIIISLENNSNALELLGNYFTAVEISLLKMGYIPLRTSKLYTLTSFKDEPLGLDCFAVPRSYKKTSGGDYYKGLAVEFIKEGSRKK